ncbi:MAG: hypothetical protein NWR72_15140 [Bacteroidia bacterium]|nr:hypothetical protein [Bacteroidia bacterium]
MIFRAQIIPTKAYHSLYSNLAVGSIAGSLGIGFLVNVGSMPLKWGILSGVATLTAMGWQMITARNMKKLSQGHSIEITPKEIRIKGKKGKLIKSYQVEELEDFSLHTDFELSGNSARDQTGMLMLKTPNRHVISWQEDGEKKEIEFLPDSHYSLAQLRKITDSWTSA